MSVTGLPATNVEVSLFEISFVEPASVASAFWKRGLDLLIASLILLVTFPAWLVVAVLVKISSPGPIIYRNKRCGLSGKTFYMLKFRSMYMDADKRVQELWAQNDMGGPIFKMKNDPRITPIGHFIRRFSLDELPQFLNVLSGNMSLVGPRALHDYEIAKLEAIDQTRLAVKPGITCYWQVMGRSNLTVEEWMELDRRYIQDASLMTDLRILAKTPKAVFAGDGAY